MGHKSLYAHVMVESGRALTGFAGIFFPIIVTTGIAQSPPTAAIIPPTILTFALAALGIGALAAGKDTLSKQ